MPRIRVSSVLAFLSPARSRGAAFWFVVVAVGMTWPLARGLTRDIPWDPGCPLLNCWSPKRLGVNRAREPLARLGHARAGHDELVAHELDDSA